MRFVRKSTMVVLAAAMLATGCSKKADTDAGTTQVQNEKPGETTKSETKPVEAPDQNGGELVEALRAKYKAASVDYSGETIRVDRGEELQVKIGYNPWDTDTKLEESFMVYQDADLKHPLADLIYDWDEAAGMLTIAPPLYGPAEVDSVEMDLSYLSGDFMAEDGGEATPGWGNLPQLYLATMVNTETGDFLSGNPLVTVVKINSEISQAPQVKFSQTDDGCARLSWKAVPGADEYLIFTIRNTDGALEGYMNVLASTTDTEWICEPDLSMDGSDTVYMNSLFNLASVTEDYLLGDGAVDDGDDFVPDWQDYFGVIAVNTTGCSPISNLFDGMELAHMLPVSEAFNSNEKEMGYTCETTLDLPATMGITMGDGSISQRVIDYDFDSIEKGMENGYYNIQGKAHGTPFATQILVTDPVWDTYDQDLDTIRDRQEKLRNKGGNVETEITIQDDDQNPVIEEPKDDETKNETPEEKPEDSLPPANPAVKDGGITANSALSEYLAMEMLDYKQEIDISLFPEAANTELLVDAFLEAQYQNPLILGIRQVGTDANHSTLYIDYENDAETTQNKRQELSEKVAEIADEIITDGMSDLEKEMAINQYLCDNASYDDAALENAEEYDFAYVDDAFIDSFNAYGVLINGSGVCASYSASFKLLADAAGLDSIVVTGYLEGNMPHAWNKVMVDGKWSIVDSTNNDNEMIQNALFNLSDDAANATLVEDDRFALDECLSDYSAPSDENEYYHITDRYFSKDAIVQELAENLRDSGNVMLRTDYDLDEEAFATIAQEAALEAQKNLNGYFWMGVIHLEEQ